MKYPERLKSVHRVVIVMLLLGVALPAAPQTSLGQTESPLAAAQTGPSLEATVGLGGFVATGRPATVTATISTPILVSGRLRVRGGGISVSRPVEVPAGGEQVYELTVPALGDGARLTVEILDTDGETIVTEAISMRAAFDELTVGVMGDDQLADTLSRVRTIITDRPVAPLIVPLDAAASTFDVLGYLVLGRGGLDRLDDALAWAQTGGGLVIDPTVAPTADLPQAPLPTGVEGVTAAPLGSGRVIIVTGLEGRSGDDWASILRPTTLDLGNSPEFGIMNMGGGLFQAASESGNRQVPSLPWLLFAILGFALLVGPVNFIVLSKLGKRDLAWVTIPVLALVAVVGFWIAGRQRIAGTNLSHATVVVADGTVEARSAVVVAAGVSGERTVSFAPEASIFPELNTFGGAAAELRIDGDNRARLELDQLGFTGIGLVTARSDLPLPTVTMEGGQVVVDNDTDLDFWGWGVMRGGSAVVARSDLEATGTGQVAAPGGVNQFGFGFIDALINERQLWDDPDRSNGLWALGPVLTSEADDSSVYFVGLTDDYQPSVSVNGAASNVPGPTLVLIRVGNATEAGGGPTSIGATVVGTGFINWLDWGAQHVVATDELTVVFSLPDPSKTAVFRDTQQFGMPANAYLAWDWSSGEFAEIDRGEPLPVSMVSADGQVFVRLVGEEFGDNPFSPDSLSLELGA
jgi:hypothetical protein